MCPFRHSDHRARTDVGDAQAQLPMRGAVQGSRRGEEWHSMGHGARGTGHGGSISVYQYQMIRSRARAPTPPLRASSRMSDVSALAGCRQRQQRIKKLSVSVVSTDYGPGTY